MSGFYWGSPMGHWKVFCAHSVLMVVFPEHQLSNNLDKVVTSFLGLLQEGEKSPITFFGNTSLQHALAESVRAMCLAS